MSRRSQPINYLQFQYLKPTTRVNAQTRTISVVFQLITDSKIYEPLPVEVLELGVGTLEIPWLIVGSSFVASVNESDSRPPTELDQL